MRQRLTERLGKSPSNIGPLDLPTWAAYIRHRQGKSSDLLWTLIEKFSPSSQRITISFITSIISVYRLSGIKNETCNYKRTSQPFFVAKTERGTDILRVNNETDKTKLTEIQDKVNQLHHPIMKFS